MADPVYVVAYDPQWPVRFAQIARPMREALGDVALRIDHIGSTAVPGLDAKPVIDIQISVGSLEPLAAFRDPLHALGYRHQPDNPDRTKRYFREPPGEPRVHIHVRQRGSWSEQQALLFRDYLRANEAARSAYATLKRRLAGQYRHERERYVEAKGPLIWEIMQQANEWSQLTGWQPGPSDM